MTIQTFSVKTGIPRSTLRFYETKNLLKAQRHQESDYRMYTEEQVPTAKLIASLRAVDISIQNIQRYLQSNEAKQMEMKVDWIKLIKERKLQLDISLRYLETSEKEEEIFLFEKAAETVIWFHAESAPGQFEQAITIRRDELREQKIPVHNIYIKFLSGNQKLVKVEIGFGVDADVEIPDSIEGKFKKMETSLCIGLTFRDRFSNIVSGYRKLYCYCIEHDWIPASSVFEWYRGDQILEMDIVMPITQVGGRDNGIQKKFNC